MAQRQRTPDTEYQLRKLLAPRYWGSWLVLALQWVAAHLPFRLQLWIGRGLGRLAARLIRPKARARLEWNLEHAFPQLDESERRQLERDFFRSMGIAFFEIANCWWASDRMLRRHVQISGLEHLEQALAAGKGAILLSGHFTTLEVGGRLLSLYSRFHPMYRPSKHPVYQWAMRRSREKHFERAIARNDIRGLLRSLKQGHAVWYAPDQAYRGTDSIMVPFFGMPASTITATARIAGISGAPLIPFFAERLPGAQGYQLHIGKPLTDVPSGDAHADATRINAVIESQVRQVPAQYLWTHDRWREERARRTQSR